MPTLPELLNQLRFINQESVLLGLFLTAGLILVIRDWRFLILALLGQYILAGLILSRLIRPDIAIIQVLIGAFICPILFLSARQVSTPLSPTSPLHEPPPLPSRSWMVNRWRQLTAVVMPILVGQQRQADSTPHGFVFRLLVALLMFLVATTLSRTLLLPGLSIEITAAVYWLILAGLATLILTEEPMKVGLGLFTTFIGFNLFYLTRENSLLVIGLWGAINLLLALVIGYLIIAKGAGMEEAV